MMLTLTPISTRALEIVADGPLVRADVPRALDTMLAFIDNAGGKADILADVRGAPDIHFDLIVEEMKRIADLPRLIRGIDRVAVVADRAWVRAAARIESLLIPGVSYQIYGRADAAHARAWVLRQTDAPHPR
jgi:hypothetical protein